MHKTNDIFYDKKLLVKKFLKERSKIISEILIKDLDVILITNVAKSNQLHPEGWFS